MNYEQVTYTASGPIPMLLGAGAKATATADEIACEFERDGDGPRRWRVRARLDRSQLLPIAEAGLFAKLTAEAILSFDIFHPVELRLRPSDALAMSLDEVEDDRPVVNVRTGVLDGAIALGVKDLTHYALEDFEQLADG